jgi:transcriptional regulator with XRE-family HTH domain
MKVSEYLLKYLQKWERLEGERKTLKQFSVYLGVSDKSLNHLWRDRRQPSQEIADQIYSVTGDPEIYDLADLDRPDYRLNFIRKNWGQFQDDDKETVMEMLSKYRTGGKSAANEPATTPKPHTPN